VAESRLVDKYGYENLSDDQRIGGACEIAEEETIKHIESLGYEIVYEDEPCKDKYPLAEEDMGVE
jgi:hypothetical protein